MSVLKGQSAIEYLTTYGWMLVAVSIVGGTIYTTVDINDGCQLGTSGLSPPFPTVTETYQYDNGTLFFELTNPEEKPIKVNNITVTDGNRTLGAIGVNKDINGEGKAQITTNRFSTSENCADRTLKINYESETLKGLATTGSLQGKISIVPLVALFDSNTTYAQTGEQISFNASETESENSIANYTWKFGDGKTATGETASHNYTQDGAYIVELTVEDETGIKDSTRKRIYIGGVLTLGGGEISRLGFHNTISTNCIGGQCQNTTTNNDESVSSRGDTMEGTLFTSKLLMLEPEMCITDTNSYGSDQGCSVYRQGADEPVSEQNYQLNGSLETPTVKPKNQSLCVGDC